MKSFFFVLWFLSVLRIYAADSTNSLSPSAIQAFARKNCAPLPARMDGILLRLIDYPDEATMRRIKTAEPNLTLADYRLINEAVAKEIQKRGGSVEFVKVDADKYFAWLKENKLENKSGNCAGYVEWLKNGSPKQLPKMTTVPLPKS